MSHARMLCLLAALLVTAGALYVAVMDSSALFGVITVVAFLIAGGIAGSGVYAGPQDTHADELNPRTLYAVVRNAAPADSRGNV